MLQPKYDVVLASGGVEALSILAADRFDLVLCDVVMPDVSGADVYERVLERDHALAQRFVFVTGTVGSELVESFLRTTGRPILQKPVRCEEIDALIRPPSGRPPRSAPVVRGDN
jgi:CheY-like chemotaxis protein